MHFLEAVQRSKIKQLRTKQDLQRAARGIAVDAKFTVEKSRELLLFGEFGIHQFNHPSGGGTSLHLERITSIDKGAIYSSHNCDRPAQQSLLLSMWVNYADFVEDSMPKPKVKA
jgi:hypothetical protein